MAGFMPSPKQNKPKEKKKTFSELYGHVVRGISSGDIDNEQADLDNYVLVIADRNRRHRAKFPMTRAGEREAERAGYPHPDGNIMARMNAHKFRDDTRGLPRTQHRDILLPSERKSKRK